MGGDVAAAEEETTRVAEVEVEKVEKAEKVKAVISFMRMVIIRLRVVSFIHFFARSSSVSSSRSEAVRCFAEHSSKSVGSASMRSYSTLNVSPWTALFQ